MNEIQTAWVAGIIEGEGCINIAHLQGFRVSISVNMTDFDVITRLREWSQVGTISTLQPRPGRKNAWIWTVSSQIDVQRLLTTIRPFLCERRSLKAKEALAVLEDKRQHGGLGRGRYHRGKTVCPKGHPYDEVNMYIDRRGTRKCRACARAAVKRWEAQDPEHAKQVHRDAQRRFRQKSR
jgi:hypothetical protein